MAAYRRVYDSRHLQADCQNRDQLRNPTLSNRVWATFSFFIDELWVSSLARDNVLCLLPLLAIHSYSNTLSHFIFCRDRSL